MTNQEEISAVLKENQMLREQLRCYLEYDQTTGLFNKTTFCKKSAALLQSHIKKTFDIVCVDIERFKLVNDLYGFEQGDRLLKYVARELKRVFGGDETILARIAGDVFAMCILRRQPDELEAKIMDIFERCPVDMTVVPAIGICRAADSAAPVGQMCDWAKMALDSVKHNYMKHVSVYDDQLRHGLLVEQEILNSMEKALEKKEFVIYFQPKCNMNTGKIVGAEALVRWLHPEKGLVAPMQFIPVFERNGFIKRLDRYVWEETAAWLRQWLDQGRFAVPVSVNISRTDFFGMDVCGIFRDILQRFQISSELLELEITESAYAGRPEKIVYTVRNLMKQGFTILMDDFGSGYSSLNMLNDIDVNVLKIDMGFLERKNKRSRDILESVIHMAKWLNLPTIAEGVQSKEQVDFLLKAGCAYAQGYYYYKPMPAEEFQALLLEPENIDDANGGKLLSVQSNYLDYRDLFHQDMMSDRLIGNILGAIALFSFSGKRLTLLRGNEEYYHLARWLCGGGEAREHIFGGIIEEDRPRLAGALEQARRSADERGAEVRVRVRNAAALCWLRIHLFHLAKSSAQELFYASFADITGQMKGIEALEISEQQFRAAMEATNHILFEVDVETKIARYSEYAQQMFGLDDTHTAAPEGFLAQGTVDAACADAFRGIYDAIYQGEAKASCTIRAVLADGSTARNRVTLQAVKDEYGRTVKAVGVVECLPEIDGSH